MLAELLGTFLIVFIGTGSVSTEIFTESLVGLFQIVSVWIIVVTIAICTTASISGAHLNPAISIAFAMIRPSKSFNSSKVKCLFCFLVFTNISDMLGNFRNLTATWFSISGTAVLYIPTSWCSLRWLVEPCCIWRFHCYLWGEERNHPRICCWYCVGKVFWRVLSVSTIFYCFTGSFLTSSLTCLFSRFWNYTVSPPVTTMTAFLAECIGTTILAFVIFALKHPNNDTVENGFIPTIIGECSPWYPFELFIEIQSYSSLAVDRVILKKVNLTMLWSLIYYFHTRFGGRGAHCCFCPVDTSRF